MERMELHTLSIELSSSLVHATKSLNCKIVGLALLHQIGSQVRVFRCLVKKQFHRLDRGFPET